MSEPDPQAGVLGQLPRTRPTVRSPRRAAAEQAPAAPAAGSEATAGRDGEASEGPGSDLEALARAGVSVAGGVASIGVRIAGEAVAALRGAIERR